MTIRLGTQERGNAGIGASASCTSCGPNYPSPPTLRPHPTPPAQAPHRPPHSDTTGPPSGPHAKQQQQRGQEEGAPADGRLLSRRPAAEGSVRGEGGSYLGRAEKVGGWQVRRERRQLGAGGRGGQGRTGAHLHRPILPQGSAHEDDLVGCG